MADSIKDELVAAQAGAAATPAAGSASTSVSQSGTISMPAYADPDRVNAINQMYDANINAQRANLQASFDQNMSNMEANRESIAKRYQQQRNAAATDYERQRRNFNEQAMTNGLATGVGSQAALAQNSAYQKQQGQINAAEGTDTSNLERNIADLKVKYQNDINAAVADNDYKRAAAMLDEYNTAYNRAQQEAQTKAQYGDFSGYAAIFGNEAAAQMKDTWMRQNPGIAYSLGYIGADAYYQLTGRYPVGYSAGGRGSGGYRSSGSNTPSTGDSTGDNTGDTVSPDDLPGSVWSNDLQLANALQRAQNAIDANVRARTYPVANTAAWNAEDAAIRATVASQQQSRTPNREVARNSAVLSTR